MIRIHNPIDLKYMVDTKHIGEHSICQTLRNIYSLSDNLKANNGHIKMQARIAMSMAKSMNKKMVENKREISRLKKMLSSAGVDNVEKQ